MLLPLLILSALLVSHPAQAQTPTQSARLFCCVENGQRICGNPLPAACYSRAYKEIGGDGRVLREVDAPLSPEQRARRQAEARERSQREQREAQARLRDQALLEAYGSVTDIDNRRERETAAVMADLQRARVREAEILAERAKLEAQRPAGGKPAAPLADELEANAGELAAIRSVIDSKLRDIEAIRARFELDRRRYLELRQTDAP